MSLGSTSEKQQQQRDGSMSQKFRSLLLLLGVSFSWVAVAQLARAAEMRTEFLQGCSVVPLLTWGNATAWMILALPHMVARHVERGHFLLHLVTSDTFISPRQPVQFLGIAFITNFSYMAALHFLPASLNTAIFCTSPIFTLVFSAVFLRGDGQPMPLSRQLLSVVLSVSGVVLITRPWGEQITGLTGLRSRVAGAGLSLLAAIGTAVYQVYFKVTFGSRMAPEEVGLFLAHMGVICSVLCGMALAVTIFFGAYQLQLDAVPWGLIFATAGASALFNFLMKFGLSRDTPVALSLATQIGIPLNLALDMLITDAKICAEQVGGTALMLLAFTLHHLSNRVGHVAGGSSLEEPLAPQALACKAHPKENARTSE